MATVGKLLFSAIVFLLFFYSTTIAMIYLYGLASAPMAF
jgi:hypothetical protein